MAKVLEGLVLDDLAFGLKKMFMPEQHGFQPGHSTVMNIILFREFITSAMSESGQVAYIFLDYSKTFYRVSNPHFENSVHMGLF